MECGVVSCFTKRGESSDSQLDRCNECVAKVGVRNVDTLREKIALNTRNAVAGNWVRGLNGKRLRK